VLFVLKHGVHVVKLFIQLLRMNGCESLPSHPRNEETPLGGDGCIVSGDMGTPDGRNPPSWTKRHHSDRHRWISSPPCLSESQVPKRTFVNKIFKSSFRHAYP
jgi:hypothetical protein